ncbi:glycosyltransferase family A protein [Enterococcus durans]|uniref:glycosyltransferase family A protein n=1 Tax=Enterococcus durans TaxID=53345 RepID=UPI00242EDA26|nr:glycosyltransferase family A protein [Enterococcus durans]
MYKFAIVIIAYNRDKSLKRLLESLEMADYNKQNVTLVISIDYSENEKVLKNAEDFRWHHGEKIIIKHSMSLGLKKHVLEVGDLTEKFDAIIVLEDDLIVSNQFYNFSVQAFEKFKNEESIAGISLYSFRTNPNNRISFYPNSNGYDNFFLQYAQSWGQVWWKSEWRNFRKWLTKKDNFESECSYPKNLNLWSENSWLKYHILFCIEKDKFFVYPLESFTGNFSEPGVHNQVIDSTFQSPLSTQKWRKEYNFSHVNEGVRYDSFFERIFSKDKIIIGSKDFLGEDIEVDLYGDKEKFEKNYCLSSKKLEYEVVSSFGLQLKPHELNFIMNIQGEQIFLYNTTIVVGSRHKTQIDYRYYFGISDYKVAWICFKKTFLNLLNLKIKNILKKLSRG